jgi:predicted component of type VI protein secretion system
VADVFTRESLGLPAYRCLCDPLFKVKAFVMEYQLVLMDPLTGGPSTRWNLKVPGVLGRGTDADIQIDDASVSRQHCRFSQNAYGELVVLDMGSVNGVYVRSQRVPKSVVDIGELIQIGALEFRVQLAEEPVVEQRFRGPSTREDTQRMPSYRVV